MANSDVMKFGSVKLNNGNFQLWKFKVEMSISKDDLWEVISEQQPEDESSVS